MAFSTWDIGGCCCGNQVCGCGNIPDSLSLSAGWVEIPTFSTQLPCGDPAFTCRPVTVTGSLTKVVDVLAALPAFASRCCDSTFALGHVPGWVGSVSVLVCPSIQGFQPSVLWFVLIAPCVLFVVEDNAAQDCTDFFGFGHCCQVTFDSIVTSCKPFMYEITRNLFGSVYVLTITG